MNASGIFGILARLGLKEVFDLTLGMRVNHFAFKAAIIRVLAKHGELVPAFEIGRDEKSVFGTFIDATTGTEIVCLVHPVETGPADPNHFLDFLLRLVFRDAKQCDVVDHSGAKEVRVERTEATASCATQEHPF